MALKATAKFEKGPSSPASKPHRPHTSLIALTPHTLRAMASIGPSKRSPTEFLSQVLLLPCPVLPSCSLLPDPLLLSSSLL
eukprot:109379-Hanusia_phi.AAC.1